MDALASKQVGLTSNLKSLTLRQQMENNIKIYKEQIKLCERAILLLDRNAEFEELTNILQQVR